MINTGQKGGWNEGRWQTLWHAYIRRGLVGANESAYEVKPLKIRPRFSFLVRNVPSSWTDENYGGADAVNHDGRHAYIFPLNSSTKVHRVSLDLRFLGGWTRQSSGGHQGWRPLFVTTPPPPFFFFISSFLQYLQQKDNIVTEKKEEKKLLAITFSPGDSGQGELSRRGRGCCGGGDVVRGDISAISNRFERKKEIKKERIPERAINQAWKLPLYYSRVKLWIICSFLFFFLFFPPSFSFRFD